MSATPLKIEGGLIKRFQNGDTLAVEERVAVLECLLNKMLIDYYQQGFVPKDATLLTQLQIALD